MKIIQKVVTTIEEEIKQFYNQHNIQKEIKTLNADIILSIFLYILAKVNLPNIICQLEFIRMLSTDNALNSLSGYYLVTLEAACSHYLTSPDY